MRRPLLRLPLLRPIAPSGRPRSELRFALLRWTATWVNASLAASIVGVGATLPIAWQTFGEWSPIGIPATLMLMPLMSAAIALGWVAVWLPSAAIDHVSISVVAAMRDGLVFWDSWAGTPSNLPLRPSWLIWSAALASYFALRRSRPRLTRLALLLAGALLVPWQPRARGLEVYALDVGHGTACAVRAPGLGALVFDAGSRDRRGLTRHALFPLLRAWDVNRVALVISHADRDHTASLAQIASRYPPTLVAGAPSARLDERLAHDSVRLDLGVGALDLPLRAGARLSLVRGLDVAGNEGSRSLILRADGDTVVLSGDAEGAGLRALLDAKRLPRDLALLLFPHHGSDTIHGAQLVRWTRPEQVWLSTSHARPGLRQALGAGLRWHSTALEGPLAWPAAAER